MKKIFVFLAVIMATLQFGSCNIDDGVNFKFITLQVVAADFPEAFEINQVYTINVIYIRPDSCTYFEGFDFRKTEDTTRDIAVIGSLLTDTDDCIEIAEKVETSFKFKVLYSEPYLFKLYTGDNQDGEPQYLEIEVPVN